MNHLHGIIHPTHCFCQIPEAELTPWVARRYQENRPTMELLQATTDPREKEIISIVGLLDVDDTTMLEMMGDVEKPEHHILHCRENVRRILGLSDLPPSGGHK